ncbi:hypothetical protein [Halomonas stenophila]|uniref:Uncharacterized protein n=1 Tax=Halomonas stenophila TaxID=795312 RepID=A0A7W5HMN1_9GAMM|nr:hypothetical protein [Halomonas stenophila]MBB3232678.1 hypothetical protein [Halomonas stenophila]
MMENHANTGSTFPLSRIVMPPRDTMAGMRTNNTPVLQPAE